MATDLLPQRHACKGLTRSATASFYDSRPPISLQDATKIAKAQIKAEARGRVGRRCCPPLGIGIPIAEKL